MTECAQCGMCCEAIPINFTKKKMREDPELSIMESPKFILKHWRRISKKEAQRRLPGIGSHQVYYECLKYDSENKLCTAHDEKPPVCRDFPWYGKDPTPLGIYLPKCSFWNDVPQDLWPQGVEPLKG